MADVAAIALGSNLSSQFGLPADNIREAVLRLSAFGTVLRVSTLIVTEPVGYVDQPRFVNAACLFETDVPPEELLETMLRIELAMGRVRGGVPLKGPRVIDLDLIFYGRRVVQSELLVLPHPAMAERRFVLEPLAEIAPEWVHPQTGKTVAAMLGGLPDERPDAGRAPLRGV